MAYFLTIADPVSGYPGGLVLKTMGGITMINACVKDVLSFLRYSMSRLELVVWLPTASPAWESSY